MARKSLQRIGDVEQRRIRNTTIHAIIFVQEHPAADDTSLYQVFERINTSGRTLLPQEIRNCVYQGALNTLLFELNSEACWRTLFGAAEDARMRDMEYILRFFALQPAEVAAVDRERLSLKKHLNTFMKRRVDLADEEVQHLRNVFLQVMNFIRATWGEVAFHNISRSSPDKLVPKFSPTIFDSISVATAMALSRMPNLVVVDPEGRRRMLLANESYRLACSKETMKKDSIVERISQALHHLYGLRYEQ